MVFIRSQCPDSFVCRWFERCFERAPEPGTTLYTRGQIVAMSSNMNRYHNRLWGKPVEVQPPSEDGVGDVTTHWKLLYNDNDGAQHIVLVNAHTGWVRQPIPYEAIEKAIAPLEEQAAEATSHESASPEAVSSPADSATATP